MSPSISDEDKLAWKKAMNDWKAQNCKLINVAMYINGDGEVVGRYEKRNLWHAER
jgi:predicted amidohydrolase